MGNCISKINKDHFFACEEKMKNIIPFFKRKIKTGVEEGIRGKAYTGLHFMKKYSNIMTFAPLETGVWWRNLFKNGLTPKDILCYPKREGWRITFKHFSFCVSLRLTQHQNKNDRL